uniref:Uncharacterized protein n=1 Tax=Tanacetum cinerariifolium TaxID=118510 RepID=A0A6L2KIE8_TANCI|nr:hypothetical protein [Tanacetum cinerariifolium]
MDKMEENKSYLRADYKKELYNALVKSYNTNKDLFDTYGTSRSRHKSSGKSAHAEEPSHTVDDSERQRVDFRPPQTWFSDTARAEKPRTSFDELMDTPIDFSAFFLNQLKIPNLTQEILVGPAFNLLKGTCKSLTELEYHFEECSKATTERID